MIPHFEEVYRAVQRSFRSAGLMGAWLDAYCKEKVEQAIP